MSAKIRWMVLSAAIEFGLSFSPLPAVALPLDQLQADQIEQVKGILKALDPLVEEKKKKGTAPLLSFEDLYAVLNSGQIVFLEEVRRVDPLALAGSSQRRPPPSGHDQFVRIDKQVVLKEGKPVVLDPQYLPVPVYDAYVRMMEAMEKDLGKPLLVESGYRSPAYQLYLFLFYLKNHNYSIRETNRFVALPGCSEHGSPSFQAIDFITPRGINGEDHPEEFEELQEYGWLRARAQEFGFHLSYPRGGPSAFEPWHWHWEAREIETHSP